MAQNVFNKDPNATLDYGFDWSQWLDVGEIITSYTITTACGLTSASSISTVSGSVITWLTGGTTGERYSVACLIVTSASRIDERTMKIDVKKR